MRKTIFLMFAMVLASVAFAQSDDNPSPVGQGHGRSNMSPQDRAKDATDKLNADAQLSKDQYNKVLAVQTDFFTQRQALRSGSQSPDNQEARDKMKQLAKERQDKVKAILTPDQWKKVQEARGQAHPGGAK